MKFNINDVFYNEKDIWNLVRICYLKDRRVLYTLGRIRLRNSNLDEYNIVNPFYKVYGTNTESITVEYEELFKLFNGYHPSSLFFSQVDIQKAIMAKREFLLERSCYLKALQITS